MQRLVKYRTQDLAVFVGGLCEFLVLLELKTSSEFCLNDQYLRKLYDQGLSAEVLEDMFTLKSSNKTKKKVARMRFQLYCLRCMQNPLDEKISANVAWIQSEQDDLVRNFLQFRSLPAGTINIKINATIENMTIYNLPSLVHELANQFFAILQTQTCFETPRFCFCLQEVRSLDVNWHGIVADFAFLRKRDVRFFFNLLLLA
jgi:hypothetical protein